MAEKIRILGIAPYPDLKISMLNIAEMRDDFLMDIYVGTMEAGVDIAKFHEHEHYDVIISRGATARLIKQAVHIPVISVTFSTYDVLRAMKLAENYPYRYAIVGFPGMTKIARVLCDLLQKNIDIVTIYHTEDTTHVLKDLKDRGFSMIIGDTIGADFAKKIGLSNILIRSGEESVEDAFNQAVEMSQGYAYMKEKKLLYEKILEQETGMFFLFDSKKNLCFYTKEEHKNNIVTLLKEELEEMPLEGIKKVYTLKNLLYTVEGQWLEISGSRYASFRLAEEKLPLITNRNGIFFSTKKQAENHYYNSFFGASGALGKMDQLLGTISKTNAPIMIIGEEGSGKDPIASYLYINSLLCHNTFIIVDCELLNDRSWAFLVNGTNSPFLESNHTYYIKNLDSLTETRYRQLSFSLLERNLHRQNQMIVSCISDLNGRISDRCLRFINHFSCQKILLPTLRERKHEIPILANLYIAKKNMELGKQIIGFEPGAIEILQGYHWPYNYTQFKRILNELVSMTTTSYINLIYTKQILDEEQKSGSFQITREHFDFNRTLHEMNRDIIQKELISMKGNQTAVSKKLGISRTTLWRYFKD